jgi:hypothetical protein
MFTRQVLVAVAIMIAMVFGSGATALAGDVGPGPDSAHHVVVGR